MAQTRAAVSRRVRGSARGVKRSRTRGSISGSEVSRQLGGAGMKVKRVAMRAKTLWSEKVDCEGEGLSVFQVSALHVRAHGPVADAQMRTMC